MSSIRLSSETGNPVSQPSWGPSIDLQQRTLRVTNFDSKVSKDMLYELFSQAGPVVNVVHKPDFAFIEFEDEDSVGYAMALFRGIELHGFELQMQPKLQNRPDYYRYLNTLKQYETTIACNPYEWWNRFGARDHPPPNYLCRGAIREPVQLPMHQAAQLPYYENHIVEQRFPPQFQPHQSNHSYDSFKHNRYSSPYEHYRSRAHNNGSDVNERYGDRYSPYARHTDNNRYRDNRYGYSQSFDDRRADNRNPNWRHRRSN